MLQGRNSSALLLGRWLSGHGRSERVLVPQSFPRSDETAEERVENGSGRREERLAPSRAAVSQRGVVQIVQVLSVHMFNSRPSTIAAWR